MPPLHRIAIVLLMATIALSSPQRDVAGLLSALRGIDGRVDSVKVEQQIVLTDGSDLVLARGTGKLLERYPGDPGIFAVLLRQRTGSQSIRVVGSVRQMDRNDCCGVEIVRAAADGIVLSQDGEKSPDEPHLKFFIENTNSPVQPTAYGPFSVLDVRTEGGVPHFLASHGKERLLIRATATAPFIELLSSREAAPLLARLNFDAGDLHTNRGRHLLIRKEIRFGPGNSFRLDSGEMPKIVEQTGNGALRQFDLPQSTYEEIARANKDDVNWVNWPIPRSQVMVEETIGPAQVVGSRLWFGKYFYSGEGYWGAGGFGYFDAVTRRFRILSPPEIRNASVFALRIDGTTAWLALGQKGEWGDSGEGVVRVDTQTLRVRKYMVPGMGTSFARYGDRLYVGTSEGLSMILPNDQTEHFFIDLNRDRTYRLSRSGVFR